MTQNALKLALNALEFWDVHGRLHQPTEEAITALKERLADPMREVQRLGQEIEQEYLFHQFQTSDGIWYPFLNQSLYETALADGRNPIRTLYTNPPQRTEPVACERCKQLEEHAYDLVGKLRVANIKLSMNKEQNT
jgi:hypothetical protein